MALDEQDLGALVGARAVLDAARNDEQLAFVQHHVAVAQLNGQLPFHDEEEVVGPGGWKGTGHAQPDHFVAPSKERLNYGQKRWPSSIPMITATT